ncbi:hypothetical protein ACWDSJ_14580 [Nocardia sp. NPDC003482]|uniref:hypothetical protein n=1 Tax=Nocardia sp. NPDC004068 TaxID=3364303 RepID=UPI00367FA58B
MSADPASAAEPVAPAFGDDIVPVGVPSTIPEAHDRLVRHLFDIGLQLHSVRAVFEGDVTTPEQIRVASDRVVGVLDDLDALIREAGLVMLDLAVSRDPAPRAAIRPVPSGRGPRRRRRG